MIKCELLIYQHQSNVDYGKEGTLHIKWYTHFVECEQFSGRTGVLRFGACSEVESRTWLRIVSPVAIIKYYVGYYNLIVALTDTFFTLLCEIRLNKYYEALTQSQVEVFLGLHCMVYFTLALCKAAKGHFTRHSTKVQYNMRQQIFTLFAVALITATVYYQKLQRRRRVRRRQIQWTTLICVHVVLSAVCCFLMWVSRDKSDDVNDGRNGEN